MAILDYDDVAEGAYFPAQQDYTLLAKYLLGVELDEDRINQISKLLNHALLSIQVDRTTDTWIEEDKSVVLTPTMQKTLELLEYERSQYKEGESVRPIYANNLLQELKFDLGILRQVEKPRPPEKIEQEKRDLFKSRIRARLAAILNAL
jgi:hypothetical protein